MVVATALAAWYIQSSPFHASTSSASSLRWGILIAPVVSFLCLRSCGATQSAWARARTRTAVVSFASLFLLAAYFVWAGQPSLKHAQALAAAGQPEPALVELRALARSDPRAASMHDELRFASIESAPINSGDWNRLGPGDFANPEGLEKADAHYLTAMAEQVSKSLAKEHPEAAMQLVAAVPARLAEDARTQHLVRAANAGVAEKAWRIVEDSRLDLTDRLAQCPSLLEHASVAGGISEAGAAAEAEPIDVSVLEKTCESLRAKQAEQQQREEQRRAALEARKVREEAQRRQAEAVRRAAAERAWARAPLRCRDGSLSPTCVCGQSSRRGCCSHHGGVSGCSASR